MDRNHIDKIAQSPEDRILLSKLWEKINRGIQRNMMTASGFLSLREQEMARFLFGQLDGLVFFGGYTEAERRMLCYLPEYLTEDSLMDEDSPITCLRAKYQAEKSLSHRDFLGSLMGFGISRESVGDICADSQSCDFFVTREVGSALVREFQGAGHIRFHLDVIPLKDAHIPQPEIQEVRDTVASVRLDAVISSGYRISRGAACEYIRTGKAAINGLPCSKADRTLNEYDCISVRGLGKIKIDQINGLTKKGRIGLVIHRYI